MEFSIGSDPEAFIVNKATGNVVSSKRFTSGTKHEPEDMGHGYALMNDNILIEGNVPPAKSKLEFIANMTNLHFMMSERASRRMAELVNSDCLQITDDLANTREAKEFGCSSFMDAWNDMIEIQTPKLVTNWRPAGFHVHVGFDDLRDDFRKAVVRAFDLFVTIPSIQMSGFNYRTSNMYGMLGAMRVTPYGVECRALGGSFFKPRHFAWVYDGVELAMNFAEQNESLLLDLNNVTTYIPEERFRIINEYKKITE